LGVAEIREKGYFGQAADKSKVLEHGPQSSRNVGLRVSANGKERGGRFMNSLIRGEGDVPLYNTFGGANSLP